MSSTRNRGNFFNWSPNKTGAGAGTEQAPPRFGANKVIGGSEPNTLGALNGVPSYFRTNQIKDGINKASSVMRGVPTELNRIDTIRNMGMTEGSITNASPLTELYKYQGFYDPQVSSMSYGSSRRDKQLYNRRKNQRKATNTRIIQDRPLG